MPYPVQWQSLTRQTRALEKFRQLGHSLQFSAWLVSHRGDLVFTVTLQTDVSSVCASLSNRDGNSKVVCLKILRFDGLGSTKLLFECKCFSESLAHSHLQASLAGGQEPQGQHGQPMASRLCRTHRTVYSPQPQPGHFLPPPYVNRP